jgi:hypothetical protein
MTMIVTTDKITGTIGTLTISTTTRTIMKAT